VRGRAFVVVGGAGVVAVVPRGAVIVVAEPADEPLPHPVAAAASAAHAAAAPIARRLTLEIRTATIRPALDASRVRGAFAAGEAGAVPVTGSSIVTRRGAAAGASTRGERRFLNPPAGDSAGLGRAEKDCMSPRFTLAAAVVAAAALGVSPLAASASEIVDRDVTNATLEVDAAGSTALVTYTDRGGAVHHVLYWGAVDWGKRFRRDYSGGWGSKHADWRTFTNACKPYDGPPLDLLVAACDAPDGSYWALQDWQRLVPNYGGTTGAEELAISHWSGQPGVLAIKTDWSYHGRWRHLYGTFTYHGRPVFGNRWTKDGVPLDRTGRNVYVDYHDTDGVWKRENAFLTHPQTGGFCYTFSTHAGRVGNGDDYRATVIGPGVSPIVRVEFAPPAPFDEVAELTAHEDQLGMLGPDRRCHIS
jgi:hypothetical protein